MGDCSTAQYQYSYPVYLSVEPINLEYKLEQFTSFTQISHEKYFLLHQPTFKAMRSSKDIIDKNASAFGDTVTSSICSFGLSYV